MWILLAVLKLLWTVEQTPYCAVFGSIYEVEEAYLADYIVYEELSEASAEVVVFEQSNRLYADRSGMWYFVAEKDFAQHKVFFTDKKNQAHFSVYFTKFESFAGCTR
jgi:hypothetical protein